MTLHLSDGDWRLADEGWWAVVDSEDTASHEIVGFVADPSEATALLLRDRPGFYGPAQRDCELIGTRECNPVEVRNRDGRGVTLIKALAPVERCLDDEDVA